MKFLRVVSVVPLFLLIGCMTLSPPAPAPSFSYSSTQLKQLNETSEQTAGVVFGITVRRNETDSLADIRVLPGVKVADVQVNGPADLAGIKIGDVILKINGFDSNDADAVERLALTVDPSQNVAFQIRRSSVVLEATLRPRLVRQAVPLKELHRIDPTRTRASYLTDTIDRPNNEKVIGARIVEVHDMSPLPIAGVHRGDLVVAIDGVPVTSAESLITTLHETYRVGDSVALEVLKDSGRFHTSVKLWEPPRYLRRLALFPLFSYTNDRERKIKKFNLIDVFPLFAYYSSEDETRYRFLVFLNFRVGNE